MSLLMVDTQVLQSILQSFMGDTSTSALEIQLWLHEVDQEKQRIGISTVVVGELLASLDAALHSEVLSTLGEAFIILSYDTAASRIFAELRARQAEKNGTPIYTRITDANVHKTRQGLKVDTLILAHALSAKADAFYTFDKAFSTLSMGLIEIRQPQPRQRPLF